MYLQIVDTEEKYFVQNKLQNVQVIQSVKYYKSFNISSSLTVWCFLDSRSCKTKSVSSERWQIISGKLIVPKMKIWIKEPDKCLMSPHTWEVDTTKENSLIFSNLEDIRHLKTMILICSPSWSETSPVSPHIDTLKFTLTSGLFQCRYRTRPRGG